MLNHGGRGVRTFLLANCLTICKAHKYNQGAHIYTQCSLIHQAFVKINIRSFALDKSKLVAHNGVHCCLTHHLEELPC